MTPPQAPTGQRVSLDDALRLVEQHRGAGRAEQATALLERIVEAKPADARLQHRIGLAALQLGKPRIALMALERAVELAPHEAVIQSHLGELLRRIGQLERAVAAGERAVALAPERPDCLLNLAAALLDRRDTKRALPLLEKVQALRPGLPTCLNNLANAYRIQGDVPRAIEAGRAAIEAEPKLVDAHANLALNLRDSGDRAGARRHLEEALRLQPGHGNALSALAMLDLLEGGLASGWERYEARWTSNELRPRPLPMPAWQGEALAGRHLFVHAEQGHGDTIHMARYLPLLLEQGARVTCEVQPALVGLLEQSIPGVAFLPRGGPPPAADLQVPLLSLPFRFKTRLDSIPGRVPYLAAGPETVARWRRRLDELAPAESLRVGVVWGGSRTHRGDFLRSLTPADLEPLAALKGVTCFSLQFGERAGEAAGWPGGRIVDLAGELGDFANTAGALVALDHIVTIDTATAHLAGALALDASLLLAAIPDWRWLLGRDDSPWYPTLRLYRQPRPGDWPTPVAAAALQLAARRDSLIAERPRL